MIKARSLSRVFQEQNKYLYNQEKPQAWHCRLLRAAAPAGSAFAIEFPEWHDRAFLIRARDLGKHRLVRFYHDGFPMFADKTVDYPGQALALLVAPEAEQLPALERQVDIRYAPGAAAADGEAPPYLVRKVGLGDADAALAASRRTVESALDQDGFYKLHFEPRGAIAEWKSEMLWVQCSTSWPQLVRRLVSESTGLPQKNITVISQPSAWLPDRFIVDSTLLACYAAMAALTCMKQVQFFLSSGEDIHYGTPQAAVRSRIVSGHDADGRLLALKARLDLDLGAWPLASQESAQALLAGLCSSYRCPNQDLEVAIRRSPHPPRFLQNQFGLNLAQSALERHVNLLCRELGLDEVQWRSAHLAAKGDATPYGPLPDQTVPAQQALHYAVQVSDFRRVSASNELLRKLRPPRDRLPSRGESRLPGIGVALGFQSHGLLTSAELAVRARVRLRLNQDGHLEIGCPMHATNSGIKDAWTAGLEEITGIDGRNMSFARFSTDTMDDSGPARFSRTASLYSPLLAAAAKALRQKMDKKAEAPLEIKLGLPNLRRLEWDEEAFAGAPFLGRSWACAVVDLAVDQVSLVPAVRAVWLGVHAGAILHPERAASQLSQQVMDCLSWLTRDQHRGGREMPAIQVDFLNQERYATEEQKLSHAGGIGELVQAALPPAFANALAQALGRHPDRLPGDGRLLHQLLRAPAEADRAAAEGERQAEP